MPLKYYRVNLSKSRFVAVSRVHKDCNGDDCHTLFFSRRGRKGEPRTVKTSINLTTEALGALLSCGYKILDDLRREIESAPPDGEKEEWK